MSAEKLRFLAVAEVKVPWEAIYQSDDVRRISGNKNEKINIVPPVSIAHSGGMPRFKATIKIVLYLRYSEIELKMEEYQSSHPTRLECTVTKTLRENTDPSPPREVVKMNGGDDVSIISFRLNSVRCFTLLLKIYAVDLSIPPVSTLTRGLNEARLRSDPTCDAFLCVEGAELPAHRVVLATQSEVFAKMFKGSFKETSDGRVLLKDTTIEAAEAFLEYLYTGHVEDYKELELELLDMAERYGVDDLKHQCKLRLWTVDAPRALRLFASSHVEDMRDRFARIILDHNWNAEGVKLVQNEQSLTAYLLRAARTPPAPVLTFP